MPIPTPFVSSCMAIDPLWIDFNGHFNMAYYGVLFDRAADECFALFGMHPDYVKATRNSWFTLETHTTYVRELQASDAVVVDLQILDSDHKRVHYVQTMRQAAEGWAACILEVMVSHVSLETHKTSNFPDGVKAIIDAMGAAHARLLVPPQVGHRIGIPRKAS
jgi:acyl-CoA thioester hydrolase